MTERLPHGQALAMARRDTARATERLTSIYGRVPPVVLFFQREADGPLEVTHGLRLVGRVAELYRGDPRPVLVRAVVPGSRALRRWFEDREIYDMDIAEFARAFGTAHALVFSASGDVAGATRRTVRRMDPFLRDFEHLYHGGVTLEGIAGLAGVSMGVVQTTVVRMRALGFDMPYRQTYARRRP